MHGCVRCGVANGFLFTKTGGVLRPGDDECREWLTRIKPGQPVILEGRLPRNPQFFRKWWALIKVGYDYWADTVPPVLYKGEEVRPSLDRFRRDITILAGFSHCVVNVRGEVRVEADSLKFGSMSEEEFAKLYCATINVLLSRVFNGKRCPQWDELKLRQVAEEILEFDT